MLRLFSRQKNQILSLSTTRHLFSTAAAASSSNLYSKYSFVPPPSLKPQNPNSTQSPPKKQPKPRYRPPSSLDRTGEKPLQSKLPFDFRFSYTESSPDVRPIGLREPKYSPFGPGKLDRVWTGVCAPVFDPKVGSPDDEKTVEAKRRVARERIQGEPLTNAERKAIVERCQRHKTKRQVNLGIHFFWKKIIYFVIYCLLLLLCSISFFAKVFKWNWESKDWYFAHALTRLCHGIDAKDFVVLLYIIAYCNCIKWKVKVKFCIKIGLVFWLEGSTQLSLILTLYWSAMVVLLYMYDLKINIISHWIWEVWQFRSYYTTYFHLPFVLFLKMDLYNLNHCMKLGCQAHIRLFKEVNVDTLMALVLLHLDAYKNALCRTQLTMYLAWRKGVKNRMNQMCY